MRKNDIIIERISGKKYKILSFNKKAMMYILEGDNDDKSTISFNITYEDLHRDFCLETETKVRNLLKDL